MEFQDLLQLLQDLGSEPVHMADLSVSLFVALPFK